jgi:hypothetical protein
VYFTERKAKAVATRRNTDAVFCKEGEYWTIVYAGTVSRLRDTRGLHCIAYLLQRPGVHVAAADLLLAAACCKRPPAARGLLRSARTVEDDRILVTKHIKAAIRKIAAHSPLLGDHLGTRIATGAVCAYVPGPGERGRWATFKRGG